MQAERLPTLLDERGKPEFGGDHNLSAGLKYPRKSSHVLAVLKTIAFEGIYDVNDSDISLLIYELHEAEKKQDGIDDVSSSDPLSLRQVSAVAEFLVHLRRDFFPPYYSVQRSFFRTLSLSHESLRGKDLDLCKNGKRKSSFA